MSNGEDLLVSFYREYMKLMVRAGYGEGISVESGHVLTVRRFAEQCGLVEVRAEIRLVCGMYEVVCAVTRSSVGNRGWGGGTRVGMFADVRGCVGFVTEYFRSARMLLS